MPYCFWRETPRKMCWYASRASDGKRAPGKANEKPWEWNDRPQKSCLRDQIIPQASPRIEAICAVIPTTRPETPPKPVEEIDGVRIRGIPESNEKEARLRQEHDHAQVQKLMAHVEVNGTEPKFFRVRDGNLFIRHGTRWFKDKTPEVHGSSSLTTFLYILILIARIILEYDRRTPFFNAITVPNHLPHRTVADWKCQRQCNFPHQLHSTPQRPTKCKWGYKTRGCSHRCCSKYSKLWNCLKF